MEQLTPFSFETSVSPFAEDRWRGPERGRLHPAPEAEMVWEAATKIKHAGDHVSVFLENFAKTSLLGMRKPGLDCFWHKAGVRN